MRHITLRVKEETFAFVRQVSGERGTAESEIWRELIDRGIHRSDEVLAQLDLLAKLAVQALCVSQRVADHMKPELIEKAREDARVLIARMKTGSGHLNGS